MISKQKRQINTILIGIDAMVFILSVIFTAKILQLIIFPIFLDKIFRFPSIIFSVLFPFLILIWLYMNWREGLYDFDRLYKHRSLIISIFQAAFKTYFLFLFFVFFLKQTRALGSRMFWLFFFLDSIIFLYVAKKGTYRLLQYLLKTKEVSKRVALCGWGESAKKIAHALSNGITYYDFVGYFDENSKSGEKYLGSFNDIEAVVKKMGIDEIIIAVTHERSDIVKKIIDTCFELHIDWKFVPDFFWAFSEETYLSRIENIPLLTIRKGDLEGLNLFFKIVLDKILAVLFIFFLSPIILVSGVLIKLSSPGPVLFKQRRVGRKGRIFELYKFRSMKVDTEDKEHKKFMEKRIKGMLTEEDKESGVYKLKSEGRVTRIGRIIRAYGIDEIPQFVNVLKGDMSIVGPRPAIPYELEWYEPWQKERLKVLPGITGLWQIRGRNVLEFDEGIKLDLKYITDWSFRLDFEIMFKTIWVLLFKRER